MRKILLAIFLVLFSCQILMAEEQDEIPVSDDTTYSEYQLEGYVDYDETQEDNTIYLEPDVEPINSIMFTAPDKKGSLNLKAPQKIGLKSLIPSRVKQIPALDVKSFETNSKFKTPEYNISPVSSSLSMKKGNVTYGTTYDSAMRRGQQVYSTGFFTRYEANHFALTSSISKNAQSRFDSSYDSIFLAPEWKITKRLSLLDAIETDIAQTYKSNEVVLRYKPHLKKYADEVQLELGAGQTFYDDSTMKSTVRFSTRFKL